MDFQDPWLWALVPLRDASADDPEERVRRRVNVPWVLAVAGAVSGVASIALVASGVSGPGLGFLLAAIGLLVVAVAWDQLVEEESENPSPLSATA